MDATGVGGANLDQAARTILRSRNPVALVAAPFTNGQAAGRATYQRFLDGPAAWWWERLGGHPEDIQGAVQPVPVPGPVEKALSALETAGLLHHTVTLATDGRLVAAGARSVTELHGSESRLRCIECGSRMEWGTVPLHPIPPRCPHCQGLVKTDALLPGEGIPADRLAAARDLIVRCDALIVVNPLALSYPAASFPLAAHRLGSLLIEVTPRESQVSGLSDAVVIGQPEIVLPALAERVAAMKLEGASR